MKTTITIEDKHEKTTKRKKTNKKQQQLNNGE